MNEISLNTLGTTIAGLRSANEQGKRCLCVHGWMDNAASFIPLQQEMPEVNLVAIDLPGHGKSAHFPTGQHYHLLDQVAYVLGAADALGWDNFNLLGHSLGGCIAPFVAIAAPERVGNLIMLEALGPMTETADELPERIKRANAAMRQDSSRLKRVYASMDDAVDARLKVTRMHRSSARHIVERNIRLSEGAYVWGYDSRLRSPSSSYLTEEQVLAVLGSVGQPTLCVLATDGYLIQREQSKARLEALKQAAIVEVSGHHHMHMDDPEASAAAIRTFLMHN